MKGGGDTQAGRHTHSYTHTHAHTRTHNAHLLLVAVRCAAHCRNVHGLHICQGQRWVHDHNCAPHIGNTRWIHVAANGCDACCCTDSDGERGATREPGGDGIASVEGGLVGLEDAGARGGEGGGIEARRGKQRCVVKEGLARTSGEGLGRKEGRKARVSECVSEGVSE